MRFCFASKEPTNHGFTQEKLESLAAAGHNMVPFYLGLSLLFFFCRMIVTALDY